MPDAPSAPQLRGLFRTTPVTRMADIERAVAARSRRSLFRDLTSLGYLSSYTHTGRYYTLRSVPDFDADGLWRYQGIGFSRDGTLKATVWRLVDTSEAGRTHRELQRRLGVRVHNPLLELVERKQLGRAPLEGEYVYVAAARRRAERQLKCRRALVAAGAPPMAPPEPTLAVEVLLEIIHGTVVRLDAQEVAARLVARGVAITAAQVEQVCRRHGVGKKTARFRSRRSRR